MLVPFSTYFTMKVETDWRINLETVVVNFILVIIAFELKANNHVSRVLWPLATSRRMLTVGSFSTIYTLENGMEWKRNYQFRIFIYDKLHDRFWKTKEDITKNSWKKQVKWMQVVVRTREVGSSFMCHLGSFRNQCPGRNSFINWHKHITIALFVFSTKYWRFFIGILL